MSPEELHVPTADPAEEAAREADAVLYDSARPEPDVWTQARIDAYWTEYWRTRARADQDSFVLVWGAPGSGKSTWTLDRVRKLDATLTPETLEDRVAFRPEHVPNIYRRTPRFGAAWIDEAVTSGLLATETFSPEQKRLVKLFATIRAKNITLFAILPSPGDLAKALRARRADFRVEVHRPEDPAGSRYAYVGAVQEGKRQFYLPDGNWLGFIDHPRANPILFHDYATSSDPAERALWNAYAPLKMRYLDETIDELDGEMREIALKRRR